MFGSCWYIVPKKTGLMFYRLSPLNSDGLGALRTFTSYKLLRSVFKNWERLLRLSIRGPARVWLIDFLSSVTCRGPLCGFWPRAAGSGWTAGDPRSGTSPTCWKPRCRRSPPAEPDLHPLAGPETMKTCIIFNSTRSACFDGLRVCTESSAHWYLL